MAHTATLRRWGCSGMPAHWSGRNTARASQSRCRRGSLRSTCPRSASTLSDLAYDDLQRCLDPFVEQGVFEGRAFAPEDRRVGVVGVQDLHEFIAAAELQVRAQEVRVVARESIVKDQVIERSAQVHTAVPDDGQDAVVHHGGDVVLLANEDVRGPEVVMDERLLLAR